MDEDKTKFQDGKKTGVSPALAGEPEVTLAGLGSSLSPPSSPFRQTNRDSSWKQAAPADTQALELAVGDVLKDRFQILEVVGEGGMGMVFKAVDVRKLEAKSRNPYVAIKVLNPGLAKNAVLVAGLQRECEKAQELSHPNIITVYDFDRDGDHVFMSMEYLIGRPLSKIIRDARHSGISLEHAWPIIRSMGEALAYAHKKHIVHSDFKPANVFVTDQEDVKVLDFGIASRLGQSDADETVFNARAEGGLTPPYASFEMLNGSRADPRDDIYAFGLVVYELLAGKHPYDRKPASTVFLEQRSGHGSLPAPVPGLSRKQWQLLRSAIEILQDRRPQKLDVWLQEFDPKRHSKGGYLIAGGVGLLMLGATAFLGYHWRQKPSSEEAKTVTADAPQIAAPDTTLAGPPLADAVSDQQGVVDLPMPAVSESPAVKHQASSKDDVLYLEAGKPQYHIGEELRLNLRSAKSGYLRVAYLSSTGEINELLPNKYQPGKVKAGMSYRIPPTGDSFKLKITGPVGVDRIVAVFSESPIPKTANIANKDGFLVNELHSLSDSAVTIRFDVIDKNG